MNMSEMSEVEIKAAIFDQLVIVENAQQTIRNLNQELANRDGNKNK